MRNTEASLIDGQKEISTKPKHREFSRLIAPKRQYTSLHSRKLLDELLGDVLEVREDLHGSHPHVCLVVGDALLLAEGLNQHVHLLQVVAGQHGEEVVVDLVLQSAAEPVHEGRRGHVAGGGHLQLPEVGALVGGVDGHAVVAQSEHQRQHQPAAGLRDDEVHEGVQRRHVVHDRADPDVVEDEAELLEQRVGHLLLVERGSLHRVLAPTTEHEHPALVGPSEARKEEHGEVEDGLPADHEASEGRVAHGLGHLQRPGEDGHGVDVRVTVGGVGARGVEVGHRVVGVVLGLPPLDGEALEDVAHEDAHHVSVGAGLEHLVVQEVVRQPAALLPEETQEKGANEVDGDRVEGGGAVDRGGKDGEVAQHLVHVVALVRIEESHRDELGAELSVRSLELLLLVGLELVVVESRGDDGLIKHADFELLQIAQSSRRMEGAKDIGAVIASVGEDDAASRVVLPARHIIDFALVRQPGIIGGTVRRKLIKSDFALVAAGG